MTHSYTELVHKYVEDLASADAASIWAELELLDEASDAQKWKAKLTAIAESYLLSSRFALMRILAKKASGKDLPKPVSMEQVRTLSPEDHNAWMHYLLELAGPSPKYDPDLHERILSRAWFDEESACAVKALQLSEAIRNNPQKLQKNLTRIEKTIKKRYATSFTREEALQLGHILHFDVNEMQWYLLRVFDTEESLRLNRSNDLIEAYCFLTGSSCEQAEALKQQYRKQTANIPKRDDWERSQSWTRKTTDALFEKVYIWMQDPKTQDQNFLSWLNQRAPGLDVPSRTARRLYRNLAAYAYDFTQSGNSVLSDKLADDLLDISKIRGETKETRNLFYSGGQLSEELCSKVARQLYLDNKTLSEQKARDNTTMWSVVTTRQNRELSVSYGIINSSRIRIQSLLMGTEEVEKGDLLYLLWYTFNLDWSDSFARDPAVISRRMFDLETIATVFLDSAALPAFYPPHLMEQSMLLSIIHAGKTGTDPAVVYGSILQSLRDPRNREAGSRRHTLQEKVDILTYYQETDITLKQCALLNGISDRTLSQWQKELTDAGLLRKVTSAK